MAHGKHQGQKGNRRATWKGKERKKERRRRERVG
jgi:hypothetical protein